MRLPSATKRSHKLLCFVVAKKDCESYFSQVFLLPGAKAISTDMFQSGISAFLWDDLGRFLLTIKHGNFDLHM